MKNNTLITVAILITLTSAAFSKFHLKAQPGFQIDLSGKWNFQVDSENVGEKERWFNNPLNDWINLPGSTDQRGIGQPEVHKSPYDALARRAMYVGKAWYQKEVEIPASWADKKVSLFLERTHWVTKVWVDGHNIGSENSLCVAHEYDLTDHVAPGKHTITICVDNTQKHFLGQFASSFSIHTQTNWNGIIGRIELNATDKVWIEDVQIYPNVGEKKADICLKIGNNTGKSVSGSIDLNVTYDTTAKLVNQQVGFNISAKQDTVKTTLFMGDDVKLWSEFSPVLYRLQSQIRTADNAYQDKKITLFGMREINVEDRSIYLNGKKLFLRGTLECCIFPLTGYPAMTVDEWSRIFKICKSYGLNHVRYHSWCPPEAAFAAADVEGIYLQPEAPRANIGNNEACDEFIEREMIKINRYYGNHPSFVLFSSGNELHSAGSPITQKMIRKIKQDDRRHLISTSSGGRGMRHEHCNSPEDDFRVRGVRGIFGESTDRDHSERIAELQTPTISHEVGQWAIYPGPAEIEKYTGVLRPVNIEHIRDDLKAKGLLHLAPAFRKVSGRQSALLYKEEIEVLLRTNNSSGFQLLDLHDYPGQGTAQVGLLDAFWDSKGAITPERFRRFCRETVPLLRMPKRTYTASEIFEADAEILHFGADDIADAQPLWMVTNDSGKTVAVGQFSKTDLTQGTRTALGKIKLPFADIAAPSHLTVAVTIEGTDIANDWNIWLYPDNVSTGPTDDVVVSESVDSKVVSAFAEGKSVLLLPPAAKLKNALPGSFKPSFWSPTWWWTEPRGGNVTMSIICDPKHPALAHFPTENFSDWQWLDLQDNSASVMLEKFPVPVEPIVRVVDNFSRNHNLGNIFEANVGSGKVLVCMIDIVNDLENRPVARQMRYSLLKYIQSNDFAPKQVLSLETLSEIYKPAPVLSSLNAKVIKTSSQQ